MESGALRSDFQQSRLITSKVLLALSKVFHITHDVSKRGAKKAIAVELAKKAKVFLETCALLEFYKSVRRKYVILEYAKSNGLIGAGNRGAEKSDTLALLILLAQKNDALLKEILLIDSVNLSGFVDMELREGTYTDRF
jgi:hypothetical protein